MSSSPQIGGASSAELPSDPLSDVLRLLQPQAAHPCRLETKGDWGLSFGDYQHVRVGAVVKGDCWLLPAGSPALHLREGDCYLLASGREYVIASAPSQAPSDGNVLFSGVRPDTLRYRIDPGEPAATIAISAGLSFDPKAAVVLLDHLPAVVAVRAGSPGAAALRPILEALEAETAMRAPGWAHARAHLGQVLFVQILRFLLEAGQVTSGWLSALRDEQIGAALALMHEKPSTAWTVPDLAAAVAMSRSNFAQRFRDLVGVPPLEYLTLWRVRSAAQVLATGERTVGQVAADFGFGSESSFRRAFKRVTGHAPSRHRHRGDFADLGVPTRPWTGVEDPPGLPESASWLSPVSKTSL